jgi:hypothetical protein
MAIFLKRTSQANIVSKHKTEEKLGINPNYEKVGKIKFKPTDKTIDFKKKSFFVYLDLFAYSDNDVKLYFYDFDSGDLINFETLVKSRIDPIDLNKFTGQNTIAQIVGGALKGNQSSLLIMILPIITLIIGIVVGHFVAPSVVTVQVPVAPSVPSV